MVLYPILLCHYLLVSWIATLPGVRGVQNIYSTVECVDVDKGERIDRDSNDGYLNVWITLQWK